MGIHDRFQTEAEGPPRNIDAEQAFIGALLLRNDVYHKTRGLVAASDFFDEIHREIFKAAESRIKAGGHADPVTLSSNFEHCEPLMGKSGPQYLAWLTSNVPTIQGAPEYAKEISRCATRRSLIVLGEDIKGAALHASADFSTDDQIAEHWQRLNALRTGLDAERAISTHDAMAEAIEHANQMHMLGTGLNGLSTGFPGIDGPLGGLSPAGLYIVAGRPGMGKSSFGASVAWNVARAGTPAVFVSLEMSARDIAGRQLAGMSGAPIQDIRNGVNLSAHIEALERARQMAKGVPCQILDMRDTTFDRLSAAIRSQHMRTPLGVAVIDYVQLIRGSAYRGINRAQEVGEITGGLKSLAKELNIPVVALAQLNRDADKRENKRPVLSDLRESGSLEQDADAVLMLYRHEYYLEQAKPEDWILQRAECAGRAEVLIAKNRHGPTATVELSFDGATAAFGNLAQDGDIHAR